MVPRPNRTGIFERLRREFQTYVALIRAILDDILDNESNIKFSGRYIYQSLSVDERRIFSLITSIVPTCEGKKGVILSTNWDELEVLANLLSSIFPKLNVLLITDKQVQAHWDWINKKYWGGDEPPLDLKDCDFLLCEPHSFLRLKWDFKGVITDIGTVCFHNVKVSDWYFSETLAIALKLSSAKLPIPLFFSSVSDLPHIRNAKRTRAPQSPMFKVGDDGSGVSWSNLINPLQGWNEYDSYLEHSIIKLHRLGGNSNYRRIRKILLLTSKQDHSVFYRLLSEQWGALQSNFEVISPFDVPSTVKTADIILVEDTLLHPRAPPNGIEYWLDIIKDALQYLKSNGEVIFFSPIEKVHGNELCISSFFPLTFSQTQREVLIQFLLFHECLLEHEIVNRISNFLDYSSVRLSSRELRFLLTRLEVYKVAKKSRGRWACTHRDTDKDAPDGWTIIRFRSFLEHRIQYLLHKRNGHEIDSEDDFNFFVIKARKLTRLFKYCPNITNLDVLLQLGSAFISDDSIEWDLGNNLNDYRYAASNFARVNPELKQYHQDDQAAPPELKEEPERLSPHRRKKPVGRKGGTDRRNNDELEERILRLIRYYERETHQPIYWEDVVKELGISRSTGYRRIQHLIDAGDLREVPTKVDGRGKPLFLELKSLRENGKSEFRGRPRKYVVTKLFDLSAIDRRTCGPCRYFHKNRCGIITDLIEMEMQEYIPYPSIRESILHKKLTYLEIIPRQRACPHFNKRKRDYHLKSLKVQHSTELNDNRITDIEKYVCVECDGDMDYLPDPWTIKCPNCHSKYTWLREDVHHRIKVNVDSEAAKNNVVRKICGTTKERVPKEGKVVKQKEAMTKRYQTQMAKMKRAAKKRNPFLYLVNVFRVFYHLLKTDFKLREVLPSKYGAVAFYMKRLLGILVSYILATMEFKTLQQYKRFEAIDVREIDDHVFVQLDQIRKLFQPPADDPDRQQTPTLKQFQTAERVIANQFSQVYKIFFEKLGFPISNRKLLRYVNEFLERPFRGSKGYSQGNTLINCAHKICYESTQTLLFDNGYGKVCPGVAEHTHPKFGVVLDLSDPVKIAYRISLIEALVEGEITEADFRSVLGRHQRDIHLMKFDSFRKLEKIIEAANQKVIYPITNSSGQLFHDEVPLWKAFEQFTTRLAHDLKSGEELTSAFVYAPIKADYEFVAQILKEYNILIPSLKNREYLQERTLKLNPRTVSSHNFAPFDVTVFDTRSCDLKILS